MGGSAFQFFLKIEWSRKKTRGARGGLWRGHFFPLCVQFPDKIDAVDYPPKGYVVCPNRAYHTLQKNALNGLLPRPVPQGAVRPRHPPLRGLRGTPLWLYGRALCGVLPGRSAAAGPLARVLLPQEPRGRPEGSGAAVGGAGRELPPRGRQPDPRRPPVQGRPLF